jgi:hypothetical protein
MASSLYYLALAVATMAVAIYNLSTSGTASALQCYNVEEMDLATYTEYNKTFTATNSTSKAPPAKETTNSKGQTTYLVNKTSSNILKLIQTVLSFIYLSLTGLSVLMTFIVWWMSNMVPEDFLNIGKCKKFTAAFCKILPPLFIIVHWIILIIICVLWIMIVTKQCEVSASTEPGAMVNASKYLTDSYTCNLVTTAIWVLIHYGGSIFREIVYQEPFMYMPDIGKPNLLRTICFKKLGP